MGAGSSAKPNAAPADAPKAEPAQGHSPGRTVVYESREKELGERAQELNQQLHVESSELRDAKNHLALEQDFNAQTGALQEELAETHQEQAEVHTALLTERAVAEDLRAGALQGHYALNRSAPEAPDHHPTYSGSGYGYRGRAELSRTGYQPHSGSRMHRSVDYISRQYRPWQDAHWSTRSGFRQLGQTKEPAIDEQLRPLQEQLAATTAELKALKSQLDKDKDLNEKLLALQQQVVTMRRDGAPQEPVAAPPVQHVALDYVRPLQQELTATQAELQELKKQVTKEKDLREQVSTLQNQLMALQADRTPPKPEVDLSQILRPLQEQLVAARTELSDVRSQMHAERSLTEQMRMMQEQLVLLQARAVPFRY